MTVFSKAGSAIAVRNGAQFAAADMGKAIIFLGAINFPLQADVLSLHLAECIAEKKLN